MRAALPFNTYSDRPPPMSASPVLLVDQMQNSTPDTEDPVQRSAKTPEDPKSNSSQVSEPDENSSDQVPASANQPPEREPEEEVGLFGFGEASSSAPVESARGSEHPTAVSNPGNGRFGDLERGIPDDLEQDLEHFLTSLASITKDAILLLMKSAGKIAAMAKRVAKGANVGDPNTTSESPETSLQSEHDTAGNSGHSQVQSSDSISEKPQSPMVAHISYYGEVLEVFTKECWNLFWHWCIMVFFVLYAAKLLTRI